MQLNCSVQKVNPELISFIWEYCDPQKSTCDPKNHSMWGKIHGDYLITKLVKSTLILVLKSQPQKKVVYRCKAENILGTDQISFEIFKIQGSLNFLKY
jgi:hypothetical protein